MYSRSRALLLLVVLASSVLDPLSGQVGSPDVPAEEVLAVQIAGVRRLVETIRESHQLGPLKTVCLMFLEDGRWIREDEVGRTEPGLVRFLEDELGLRTRPRSNCVKGGDAFTLPERLFRDSEDGAPAALLRVLVPTFRSPTEATLHLGYHFGPLWGQGFECRLLRTESGWQIAEWKPTWVS